MAIFGALAGLTAAGLYAVVDELRVSHKIRSYKLPGTIQVYDYTINDERFDGIIRRFENDWSLDGGTLYPEKLIGFFAENPKAREQWVRMQASILLHDNAERRSCENDIAKFGDESKRYDLLYSSDEMAYLYAHYPQDWLNENIEKSDPYMGPRKRRIRKFFETLSPVVPIIAGVLMIIAGAIFIPYITSKVLLYGIFIIGGVLIAISAIIGLSGK